MAQHAERIPAWRRLGLALKNEHQSGVAVPAHQPSQSDPQPSATHDGLQTSQEQFGAPNEPAANGKSSKLGKRKHQHEPADDHQEDPKKSRIVATEGESNGAAGHDLPETTAVEIAAVEAVPDATPANGAQKKGDSNYRKKKEKPTKPNKRRKQDRDVQNPNLEARNQSGRGSALSLDEAMRATGPSTLLASTESDFTPTAPNATPQRIPKKSSRKDTSGSPSADDPRKSVAFTPDTKRSDGNTGQDYFKAWVAEQKGTGAVSQPPEVSNFVLHSLIADEEILARSNGQLDGKKTTESDGLRAEGTKEEEPPPSEPVATEQKATTKSLALKSATTPSTTPATKSSATLNTAKGSKKDPSIYIAYLTQYYSDRDNWKFNKAKQNDVVDNALNIFRIPDEHSEALAEYVAGLKGAGVIERLRERGNAIIKDLDEQDAQNPMDDAEARKVAQEEAEHELIVRERKRRRTDSDVADLATHPHSAGFVRRLQRSRAKALLNALGRAAPVSPAVTPKTGFNSLVENVAPPERNVNRSQRRKRRTEVSSDESSSDNSSDEESSDSASGDDSETGSNSESESDDGLPRKRKRANSSDSVKSKSSNSDGSGESDSD
jgi:hypothetical protein